jgi:hypothetical protein
LKTFTSSVGFQDESGTLLKFGSLILTLPEGLYEIGAGGGQVVGGSRTINLDVNAKVPAATTGWASDELIPQPAFQVTICSGANGLGKVGYATWFITGSSPIDLSLIVNTTGGSTPSIPGVVFTQPAGPQVINGQTLTMEGAALGFSATSSITPDAFVHRGGIGIVDIGTTTGNASGTINAGAYQVNGAAATGTGPLVEQTSPTLITPTFTGTATFTGTVDAPAFTVSGAAMNGASGGLVRATSPSLTTPTLASPTITSGTITSATIASPTITGATVSGATTFLGQAITEFRIQKFTGLSVTSPAAIDGQDFVTTLTWSSPFADAIYLVFAQILGATVGSPVVVGANPASASTVAVTFTSASDIQATVTSVLLIAFHL